MLAPMLPQAAAALSSEYIFSIVTVHSPGHISLYFPDAELFVSADALNIFDCDPSGPHQDVTADLARAWDSVKRLGKFDIAATFCFRGGYVEADSARINRSLALRGHQIS
jgi:glyoxylase-like metal-dependent hydrolase (beta-lactamase superfamily II)